jgi:membrane protease subunit HflK
MAWNEPGGGDKDPWGNRGDQGPPDLDEAIRQLQGKLSGIFGKGGSGGGGASAGLSSGVIGLAAIVLVAIYVFMGIYQVDVQERAVVFRFGAVQQDVKAPGLHWNPPLIDRVDIVNVTQVRSEDHQALMLTTDENIVDVSVTVQWLIDNAVSYLVNVRDPEVSLKHATESALRHVVGSSTMDQVITDGREAIGIEVQGRLQDYLNSYGTGILINKVNIDRSAPPSQVQDAFDDVQKAKEDEQRFINQATAYSQQVVPEARGRAERQIQEATAYRDQVIARADGEAQRFEKLLVEYSQATQVTRDRLYIDAMESVFSNSSKVMVDVEGGNSMLYLPLDRLSQNRPLPEVDRDAMRQVTEEIRREINSAARSSGTRIRGNN